MNRATIFFRLVAALISKIRLGIATRKEKLPMSCCVHAFLIWATSFSTHRCFFLYRTNCRANSGRNSTRLHAGRRSQFCPAVRDKRCVCNSALRHKCAFMAITYEFFISYESPAELMNNLEEIHASLRCSVLQWQYTLQRACRMKTTACECITL